MKGACACLEVKTGDKAQTFEITLLEIINLLDATFKCGVVVLSDAHVHADGMRTLLPIDCRKHIRIAATILRDIAAQEHQCPSLTEC